MSHWISVDYLKPIFARLGACLMLVFASAAVSSSENADGKNLTDTVQTQWTEFKVEEVAVGFNKPWSMEFLPDGDALISDRDVGKIHRVNISSGERTLIRGLPTLFRSNKLSAGVFDVRLHPNYQENGWVYVCYTVGGPEASGLAVDRFLLVDNQLTNQEVLFRSRPLLDNKWHFGGRLIVHDGYLFLSIGDGYNHLTLAQDLSTHSGKIIRLRDDGSIPQDNPFVATPGALPEIWSLGLRNPQGMAVNPKSGEVWSIEHGPQGGDEVNVMRAGHNYGWPTISYGEEYGGGPIGEGITHKLGLEQPLYYFRPSIAPSGLMFYDGSAFPAWQHSMFTGALALTHLNRMQIVNDKVVHEERMLEGRGWRVRFVRQGADGFIYFGSDDGVIRRMVPTSKK